MVIINMWDDLKKVVNPDIINIIGYMVDRKCFRQTENHTTLTKDDFKMFALQKILSSEKCKQLDLNDNKQKNYLFTVVRNSIQDNYDKFLPIRKPYGKLKQNNIVISNLENLNIDTTESLQNGEPEIIYQIGMKNYYKLLEYSETKNLTCNEARKIRNKIDLKMLKQDLQNG